MRLEARRIARSAVGVVVRFRRERARLPGALDALAVQWMAGTDAEYKIIARTFLSVFPQTTVWGGGSLLVGMTEPLHLARRDFDWKLMSPGRARGLHDLGIESFEALLGAFNAGPDGSPSLSVPGRS